MCSHNRLGRRRSLVGGMLFAAVASIIAVSIPVDRSNTGIVFDNDAHPFSEFISDENLHGAISVSSRYRSLAKEIFMSSESSKNYIDDWPRFKTDLH